MLLVVAATSLSGRWSDVRFPNRSCRAGEKPAEQVVGRQVLERVEALADRPHLLGRQVAALTIESRRCLPQAEVASGPGPRPRRGGGREPVGGPLADPRQCTVRTALTSSVRAASSSRSRSPRARPITYSALRSRTPRIVSSSGSAPAICSRIGNAYARSARTPRSIRLPDREGRERDLLRGDRRDEALERLDRDWGRGPAAARRARRGRSPSGGRRTLQLESAPRACGRRLDRRVERLDVHRPRQPRSSPHARRRPMQPFLVPEVRQVGPERAVPSRRELERVRLAESEKGHSGGLSRVERQRAPSTGHRKDGSSEKCSNEAPGR